VVFLVTGATALVGLSGSFAQVLPGCRVGRRDRSRIGPFQHGVRLAILFAVWAEERRGV
jgi:hypothetical protein